ncbi:uncharacterized protein LOC119583263 isoform X1 [Penaeus monodon]|uniref:uncharacterized protein LOC119583263 isoform X1 n=1 Tax=Penaeus monodon TaxID=6687 RepID=UPI0018A726A9|nr:uncharacterized protein LOC119583263 isoform X1 [Penaeus monodon]XP_037787672.1 uncharacterized protein LOC119583263 isoform X1 [Penaeus monodon]
MLGKLKQGMRSLLSSIILAMMLPVAPLNLGGFDKDDIHFARFYKAATQTNKRALKEIFLLMFYRAGVRPIEIWSKTVQGFCVEVLGWSNRKIRETFNAAEREKIEEPLNTADYDISLLVKLLGKLFEEYRLPGPLIRAILALKIVRNRVCHEQLAVDEISLRDNMEDLKHLLENLFDEASNFFGVDLGSLKQSYLAEIDEIKSAPLTGQATTYFEKMKQFREDLVGKFITHGRRELMAFYANLKILNPFTWLSDDKFPELLVDKIFTPLHIQEIGRVIDIETLLITELFCEKQQIPLGILPSVLILCGIAGCGKTSLCRYILHVWRTRMGTIEGLRSVDILIFIEARNVTESSLVSYMQKTLLRETCDYFDEKEIMLTLQKVNVLFVIDGMDEATTNGRALVEEILSTLGSARMIITTRPEFTSLLTQKATKHHCKLLTLKIKGFTPQGLRDFISSMLMRYEPDKEKCHRMEVEFKSYLNSTGTAFGDHLKLPLTIALLIILWKDNTSRVSKITSSTLLFSELFRLCAMKLISRLQASTSLHHIELEGIINDWLMILAEEAFSMLDEGKFVIEQAKQMKLSSFCRKVNIDAVQTLSAFLLCEVKESVGGVNHSFSFIHKSQMEYLASLHIVRHLPRDHPDVMSKVPSLLKDPILLKIRETGWWNTVVFTLGNLCIENKVTDGILHCITKILLSGSRSTSIGTLWRIIQESNCHPLVSELVTATISLELIWKPDHESLCDPLNPMKLILQNTDFAPKGVLMRIYGSVSQGNVAVKGGACEVRENINVFPILRLLSKRPDTNVVLRMDQHYYEWGNSETGDDLLTTLLPGGRLTAFMGHLDVKGVSALVNMQYLGEVFVRISSGEALQALSKSLMETETVIMKLTLRLDIPLEESVKSIPRLDKPTVMSVIMKNVSDENETWAAEAVSRLGQTYDEVDLVASNLTPAGGIKFMKKLVKKEIAVTHKVTIRTCHRIEPEERKALLQIMECQTEWLW